MDLREKFKKETGKKALEWIDNADQPILITSKAYLRWLEEKAGKVDTIVTGTRLAKDFHKWYEELAPEFGYETREDTKELDFDSKNGKLMLAVCERIIEKYQ